MLKTELQNARTVLEQWTGVAQKDFFPSEWAQPIPDVSQKVSFLKVIASYLGMWPEQLKSFLGHRALDQLLSKLELINPGWSPDQGIPPNWEEAGIVKALGATIDDDLTASQWDALINAYGKSLEEFNNKPQLEQPQPSLKQHQPQPKKSTEAASIADISLKNQAKLLPDEVLDQYRETIGHLYTWASIASALRKINLQLGVISNTTVLNKGNVASWGKNVKPKNRNLYTLLRHLVLDHQKLNDEGILERIGGKE